jgi:hypothetical protein
LGFASAFALVEQTDGFETKTLMQLIQSSMVLQDPPTQGQRELAAEAWAKAEHALPPELVVNSHLDLPETEE